MKLSITLVSLWLVLTPVLCSQVSQEKEAVPKSENSTTRARRADESPSPTKPVDPRATSKIENTTPVVDDERGSDQKEPAKTEPADPFGELRNKIAAANSDSERINLRLQLADELSKAGRKSEGINELRSISQMDVFDPQGFYNTGNAFARYGENESAIETYRKAIDQRKGNYSRAYNNLGVLLLRAGRWDEAYNALLMALKLESFRYAEASYNLGRLYSAQGQQDLAAREWRRTLSIDPKHTAAAEALRGPEERVVVGSRNPNGKRVAGSTPKTAGNKTLILDQASFNYLQRARVANEKGNSAEAVTNYKKVISNQAGYFAPANLELGFALLTLKQYDEALSNIQMVASKDGMRFPISYYHVGRIYELKKDLKQAEAWFVQAAASFGEQNPQFLLDVTRVRERQGDYQGAVESMEHYVSLMRRKGEEPSWSNERLTALRHKVVAPKN